MRQSTFLLFVVIIAYAIVMHGFSPVYLLIFVSYANMISKYLPNSKAMEIAHSWILAAAITIGGTHSPILIAAATAPKSEIIPTEENLMEAQNEIAILDIHIKATEESLERQQQLRILLIEYKQIESACITNPSDTQLLFKLARAGKALQESIENNCLTEYFPPDFIRELHKLKQIADKKSIPPAK